MKKRIVGWIVREGTEPKKGRYLAPRGFALADTFLWVDSRKGAFRYTMGRPGHEVYEGGPACRVVRLVAVDRAARDARLRAEGAKEERARCKKDVVHCLIKRRWGPSQQALANEILATIREREEHEGRRP